MGDLVNITAVALLLLSLMVALVRRIDKRRSDRWEN